MESSNSPGRRKPLIIFVDDDELVCRAIRRLLSSRGMHAVTFSSSAAFVELLPDLRLEPACVVLDMHMPGFCGLAVQERLAALRPELPVIFLSAHIEEHERERALAAGALGVFHKALP